MIKSLVVNCSLNSTNSKNLLEIVEKFSDYKVVQFGEITEGYQIDKDIDAIVISGSVARIVDPKDQTKFRGVGHLIKSCNVPIFGICFGHQLLSWSFGAKVGSPPQRGVDRFEDIRIMDADGIFAGFEKNQTVPLAENHFDYVLKENLDSAGFALLADSASCEVEAVKHKTKPFYGVQFLPERITIKNEKQPEGYNVIENFYTNEVKR